jgi:CRISPR-associated protein Cas2
MLLLIAYDVATATPAGPRRLRRVAQACEDYGQRVQKSLFECRLGAVQWSALKVRLLEEIDPREDSLRVYYLDGDVRVEHYGSDEPRDMDALLVV